jgi:hypothetical protein
MKHIKTINELFGLNTEIRRKINRDEDTALEILDSLDDTTRVYASSLGTYDFELKNGSFVVVNHNNLSLNGIQIQVSKSIIQEIYNRCNHIERSSSTHSREKLSQIQHKLHKWKSR